MTPAEDVMNKDNRFRVPTMLSEEELLTLINEARPDTPVEVAFGGKLLAVPSNEWAFQRIESIRGVSLWGYPDVRAPGE